MPARKKAKAARKTSSRAKRTAAKAKPRATRAGKASAAGKPARRGCAAMDPFGGPCQSQPRPGSKYCTIHSYLDR